VVFVVVFFRLSLYSIASLSVPSTVTSLPPLISLHNRFTFAYHSTHFPLRRSLTLLFSLSSPFLRFYLTFISLYLTFISLLSHSTLFTVFAILSHFTVFKLYFTLPPRDRLCQVRFRTNAYDASTKGWSLGGKAPAWSVNGQQPGNERGGLRDNNVKDDGFVPTSHQRALRALESIPYESDWHRAQRADAAWTPMAPAAVSATGMRSAPFLACLLHLRLLHAATT
jgi:hypothetical protein